MVSQYERQAWSNLGRDLGQAFQTWGQQRARRAEFDASMAMAELQRRDAKEARDEGLAIEREVLELNKMKTEADIARADEDAEDRRAREDLNLRAEKATAIMALGKFDPTAAGEMAGKELAGGIQKAEGVLPKVGAAIKGFGPALRKGAADAPRESYTDLAEYLREANIPLDVAGRIITLAGGVEAITLSPTEQQAELNVALQTGVVTPGVEQWRGAIEEQHEYNQLIQQYDLEGTKMDVEVKGKQSQLLTMQMEEAGPFKRRPVAPKAPKSPLDALGMTPSDAFKFIWGKKKEWKELKSTVPKIDSMTGEPLIVDGKRVYETKWVEVELDEYINDSSLAKGIRDFYSGTAEDDISEFTIEELEGMLPGADAKAGEEPAPTMRVLEGDELREFVLQFTADTEPETIAKFAGVSLEAVLAILVEGKPDTE